MSTATHGVFTRKQANTLFASHKSGVIFMTRKQINGMYAIIGYSYKDMDAEQRELKKNLELALEYIYMGKHDLAQDCINGKPVDDSLEGMAYAADVDRFDAWNIEPECISIEPTFNGYRIVC